MPDSMKITVKTVKGGDAPFQVDVTADDSIAVLKQKVQEAKPEFAADGQKLISQGRIMTNEKKVGDFNLKEGDFVVCIPGKKAPAPEPVATATGSATAETPAGGTAASAGATSGTPADGTASGTPVQPPVAAAPASNNREAEAAIGQLMEMGFPREQCEAALRAAYGNPDRAVEYLFSGIPEQQEEAMPPAAAGGMPQGGAPEGAPAVPPAGAGVPAAGLQGMAFPSMEGGQPAAPQQAAAGDQMAQLRAALQANPQMLQHVLAQLGQTNPELLQAFQQNPEMLMQILAGQMGGGMGEGMEGMGGGVPGGMPPGAMPQAGGGDGGQISIALSEEDRAAVERLEQLGFPRAACVQAYMAAEKNEELAANLLFDMGDDM